MRQAAKGLLQGAAAKAMNLFLVGMLCMACGPAGAQAYPAKPIKIVVPWAAGGVTDIAARAMAQKLSDRLSVPVVVDNKGGAAGTIGAGSVASAPADGYTLLLASSETHTIAPNLHARLSYAPQRDFVAIMPFAIVPFALVARRDFPANTVDELVAVIKKNPGKFTYASPGLGSTSQMAMEALKGLAGLDVLHIPFQSQPPAMLALTSGQADLQMLAAGQANAAFKSGSLKVIAVTTGERVAGMEDVPTFKESGVPAMVFYNWYGLVAPMGVPAPVTQRLAAEMAAVMKAGDFRATLQRLGLMDVNPPMSPAEFERYLESEMVRWGNVIRNANIKPE